MTEPSKHRRADPAPEAPAEARAGSRAGARAGSRAGIRAGAPAGARRAESRRAEPRPGWYRTTTGLAVLGVVGFVVVAVLLATVLRAVFWNDDDASPAATKQENPGAVNAQYGNEWKAPDGSKFEISVQTLTDQVAVGSASGCIRPPTAGSSTNLHFTVTVINKGKKAAALPEVAFGTNVKASGDLVGGTLTFARSNKAVEITPLVAQTCEAGRVIKPDGRDKIPAGGTAVFTGTFGPVRTPVPSGVTVVVRYAEADASKEDGERSSDFLATFGKF